MKGRQMIDIPCRDKVTEREGYKEALLSFPVYYS